MLVWKYQDMCVSCRDICVHQFPIHFISKVPKTHLHYLMGFGCTILTGTHYSCVRVQVRVPPFTNVVLTVFAPMQISNVYTGPKLATTSDMVQHGPTLVANPTIQPKNCPNLFSVFHWCKPHFSVICIPTHLNAHSHTTFKVLRIKHDPSGMIDIPAKNY